MKTVEDFSRRLSDLISETKISYEELSKKTKINPQTLNRWALGQRTPKITSVPPLAAAFGVNPLWLCGYDVPRLVPAHCCTYVYPPECVDLEKICLQLNQAGMDALMKYAKYLLTEDANKKGIENNKDVRKQAG